MKCAPIIFNGHPSDEQIRMKCDQCVALMINGLFCHETGCPNTKKEYNTASGEWVKQFLCTDRINGVPCDSQCESCAREEFDIDDDDFFDEVIEDEENEYDYDDERDTSFTPY